MLPLKSPHQFGQKILPWDRAGPKRKFSFDALGEFAQGIEQILANRQDFRSISKKHFSCFCQADFPARSIEEAEREGSLKGKDMAAHGWLSEEEIIRGPGKTFQDGHPAECFKVTEIDNERLLFHADSNLNTLISKSKKKINLFIKLQ
jgi:hypothetical protein